MRSDQAVRRLLAGAVALVGLLAAAPAAQAAGTYDVNECTAANPETPDASQLNYTGSRYSVFYDCNAPNGALRAESQFNSSPSGTFAGWYFTDAPDTEIESASIDYTLSPTTDGHDPIVFTTDTGTPIVQVSSGPAEKTGTYTASGDDFYAIGAGVQCADVAGCPASYGVGGRLEAAHFQMRDLTPPKAPSFYYFTALGGLNSWAGQSASYGISESDKGMGVGHSTLSINGTDVDTNALCLDPGAAGYNSMQPCPATSFHGVDVDLTQAPFHEGINTSKVCTYENSDGGANTCSSGTIRVDNIAPANVQDLEAAQGSDWQTSDQIDLSWDPLVESGPTPTAPIVSAEVEITGPDGYDSTESFSNDPLNQAHITLPFEGEFQAHVYLRDEAGNAAAANASTVRLRWDGTPPPDSDVADPSEWVSRGELAAGYTERWSKPKPAEVQVSGIEGYATDVDQDPATDPCAGGAELYLCGGPVDQQGIDSNARTLHTGDVAEGTNYVHVVPVSGAGIRAEDVGTGEVPVDLTDPVAQVAGDPGSSWVNHSVTLTATATDALSGMNPDGDFPGDDLARTAIEVDGQLAQDAGADVTTTISDEGSHQVSYSARDVAGNSSTPVPLTVRIDKSGPQLTFPDEQSGTKITAAIADPLSGPAGGELAYRQLGTSEWKPLQTTFTGAALEADSSQIVVDAGTTYQLRATGRDVAGNVSTVRAPGPSSVAGGGPAAPSSLRIALDRKKVGYDDRALLRGRLRSQVSVAGAEVRVTQAFGKGSKPRTLRRPVKVGADGRFEVKLQRGPSRRVSVSFAGDTSHEPSRSEEISLGVRGRLSLAAPKLLSSSEVLELRGRISSRNLRLTPAGKLVVVEIRSSGGTWSPLERVRSTRHGAWSAEVGDLRPGRYEVRARVPRQRGFPYLPSKSKPRTISVEKE